MRDKYPFFKYITGDSVIHLMNSKMKIAWFLLTLVSILLLNDYVSSLIILLFLFFIMYKSKIDIDAYRTNILVVWPVYVITFVITLAISIDIPFSILMSIKVSFLILLFLILTFTTSLSEIAWGFECLFIKFKKIHFPVSRISLKIALLIKFISTLFEQFRTVRKSMAYRGIPYKKGCSVKSFRMMFFPVVRISYKLSLRMGTAMKLRFYGNSKRRTNYHENKTNKFDKILIWICLIIIYVTVWFGWLR